MLNAGLIGVGGFGKTHLDVLTRLEREGALRLAAVAQCDPDSYRETLDNLRMRGVKVHNNYIDMLEEGGIDLVTIPTGIHLHKRMAVDCMSRGVHAYVEKPPAALAADVREMIACSEEYGKRCIVGFNWQVSRVLRRMLEEIFEGGMGAVRHITGTAMACRGEKYYTRSNWSGKIRLGDVPILDGTINNPFAHILNNCLILASSDKGRTARIKSVYAEMYRAHDIETEDTTSMRIWTENGVDILFNTTTCVEPGIDLREIDVECENGKMIFDNNGKARMFYKNGNMEECGFPQDNDHQYLIYRNFLRCLDGDPTAGVYMIEDGLNFTIAVNAAFESSGAVMLVDNRFLIIKERNGDRFPCIMGIEALIDECRRTRTLYSEGGAGWTGTAGRNNHRIVNVCQM